MKNKSSFTVRQEREAEFPAIYELIRTAFATAEVSDGDEQDFANRLRIHGNYIPELALVAECQGKLIGHIMLTRTVVTQDDGTPYEALMIAPLSVVPEELAPYFMVHELIPGSLKSVHGTIDLHA